MKKNEQDILNKIHDKMQDVEVPESLSPENIEVKLKIKETKVSNMRKRYFAGLAAACVAVAAGVFTMSSLSGRTGQDEAAGNPAGSELSGAEASIPTAADYEEVYSYIENIYEVQEAGSGARLFSLGGAKEEAVMESSSADMAAVTTAASDYSTTNVRQEGVDEADSVKTDGTYLYVLKDDGRTVSIVDAASLKEINEITVDEKYYIHEFYMLPEEKKVVLAGSFYEESDNEKQERGIAPMYLGGNQSSILTYDVQDVKNPKQLGEVIQSGSYSTSRAADGYVYLFSFYRAGDNLAKEQPETYIPMVNGNLLEADDIYLPSIEKGITYTVISSISLDDSGKIADSKALFSEGGQLYVSSNNIYYYETDWSQEDSVTNIRKVSYKNGKLEAKAQTDMAGYINDSFSIDEYDGYLRVVATVGDTNSVYVMDEKLDITGKIEGLAEDERIYSARFMGATGYFVTFEETDPLFTVDLSNPKDPQIIGKLKIPGFSDYLHFYGEDKLLGIGMDVDPETLVTGGVKLSMFDISDRSAVKEEAVYIMENVYSTDVSFDYKAALVDVNKNIIGFGAYPEGQQNYYVFSYDEETGFTCHMEEALNGNASRSARGLYIDDTLYVVQGNVIESYSLVSFEKLDDAVL